MTPLFMKNIWPPWASELQYCKSVKPKGKYWKFVLGFVLLDIYFVHLPHRRRSIFKHTLIQKFSSEMHHPIFWSVARIHDFGRNMVICWSLLYKFWCHEVVNRRRVQKWYMYKSAIRTCGVLLCCEYKVEQVVYVCETVHHFEVKSNCESQIIPT